VLEDIDTLIYAKDLLISNEDREMLFDHLLVLLRHWQNNCQSCSNGVEDIEKMQHNNADCEPFEYQFLVKNILEIIKNMLDDSESESDLPEHIKSNDVSSSKELISSLLLQLEEMMSVQEPNELIYLKQQDDSLEEEHKTLKTDRVIEISMNKTRQLEDKMKQLEADNEKHRSYKDEAIKYKEFQLKMKKHETDLDRQAMSSLVVVAIDFGTTYSGWAFSYKDDYKRDPLKITTNAIQNTNISPKVPTCILINSDGETPHSIGYEAEDYYAEICENGEQYQWFFFKRFKMMLFREKGMTRRDTLEDETGKKLPAMRVFSLFIDFLRKDVLEILSKHIDESFFASDIHWVLTVPAIWNDAAKQFMREAAQQAGIPGKNLSLCLEPEAASIYCRHLAVSMCTTLISPFSPGTKYLVLDAGGGTVDITVHEVTHNGNLKELYKASGGAWGGTKVDEAFEEFLSRIVGPEVISKFKSECYDDYIHLFCEFESSKRQFFQSTRSAVTMRIPISLYDLCNVFKKTNVRELIRQSRFESKVRLFGGKLRIDCDVFNEFFEPTVRKIISHVENILTESSVDGCAAILMVGGFSGSLVLQENVKSTFKDLNVIIPVDTELAVVKGAVIFGHQPATITERICKYTYGNETTHRYSDRCNHPKGRVEKDENGDLRCHDIFRIHVKTGQSVKLDEEQPERITCPITDNQTTIGVDVYVSSSTNPQLTTEDGCNHIGSLTVPISDTSSGRNHKFGISFIFGGTEIVVKVVDKESGEMMLKSVDFLG
ncbi:heat shock 70 kDa protein 12B-like, partial [Ruditapes philippinarum]|uniref:heat shock 70 kDa protein 12B-like n=1 Tax=Ruditapes philippinarum TaxID=129788 RepID=UPI00295BDC07